jgi:hypothetical protein
MRVLVLGAQEPGADHNKNDSVFDLFKKNMADKMPEKRVEWMRLSKDGKESFQKFLSLKNLNYLSPDFVLIFSPDDDVENILRVSRLIGARVILIYRLAIEETDFEAMSKESEKKKRLWEAASDYDAFFLETSINEAEDVMVRKVAEVLSKERKAPESSSGSPGKDSGR